MSLSWQWSRWRWRTSLSSTCRCALTPNRVNNDPLVDLHDHWYPAQSESESLMIWTGVSPWESGAGSWGSMMDTKSLVWLACLRRCKRFSKSTSWGFDKELESCLAGYLTSSLSCDIYRSFPSAVRCFEWNFESHLTLPEESSPMNADLTYLNKIDL